MIWDLLMPSPSLKIFFFTNLLKESFVNRNCNWGWRVYFNFCIWWPISEFLVKYFPCISYSALFFLKTSNPLFVFHIFFYPILHFCFSFSIHFSNSNYDYVINQLLQILWEYTLISTIHMVINTLECLVVQI